MNASRSGEDLALGVMASAVVLFLLLASGGLTAAWLGAKWAVILGGVGTVAVVSLWALLFPGLRRVDRLEGSGGA